MKLTRLIRLTAAIVATMAFVQVTPDFSGNWKVNKDTVPIAPPAPPPPPPPPPGGGLPPPPPPPPPQTIEITIAQTPTEFRVDRVMVSGDRKGVNKSLYKLDGTESTNQMGPITSRSKASWEGSKLVITSVLSIDGKDLGTAKETYSLEGSELVVEYNRITPATNIVGRTTYVREGRF